MLVFVVVGGELGRMRTAEPAMSESVGRAGVVVPVARAQRIAHDLWLV